MLHLDRGPKSRAAGRLPPTIDRDVVSLEEDERAACR